VHVTGDVLSTCGYQPQDWTPIHVPTTVVAALVKAKIYPDPTVAMNLRKLPGVEYPIGDNFAKLAMPPSSPFAVSWWYRKPFDLPTPTAGRHFELHFEGINYRANIWLNGQRLADTTSIAGAWRSYTFDITQFLNADGKNVLAVEVFAPTEKDLALTFADWNPMPPDKNMGIYRKGIPHSQRAGHPGSPHALIAGKLPRQRPCGVKHLRGGEEYDQPIAAGRSARHTRRGPLRASRSACARRKQGRQLRGQRLSAIDPQPSRFMVARADGEAASLSATPGV
jgi:hypothetical protein